MPNQYMRAILLMIAVASQSACGAGGGASHVASTPPPSPQPSPTPTPTPTPTPAGAYLTPGISQSTSFATTGWELDAGDLQSGDLATTGFGVSYDATTQKYSVALPSYGGAASTFQQLDQSSSYYSGVINSPGPQPADIAFRKPGAYQFTNIASVEVMSGSPHSVFAFGEATPAGGVPVTGSATYTGDVEGTTFSNLYYFRGSATLNFNFAGGTLGGALGLGIYDMGGGFRSLGTYSFVNTVYGTGNTSFSGGLRNSSNGLTGAFLGQFTGPSAEELMARWNADFVNPDTHVTETAVGAIIGRRAGGP